MYWAGDFWRVFHSAAYHYPVAPDEKDRSGAIDFYTGFGQMLPCAMCKAHYAQLLERMPVRDAVGSRPDLLMWTINFHNEVNVKTGKAPVPPDQAIAMIETQQTSPPHRIHTPVLVGGTFVVAVLSALAARGTSSYRKKITTTH